MSKSIGVIDLYGTTDIGAEHGGKAVGLNELTRLGLQIPAALALNAANVRALLQRESAALTALANWLAESQTPVAVRSSAANEDGGLQSFAGVFRTELNVFPDVEAALVAIDLVSSSGQSARAAAYSGGSIDRIPVVIQRMVDAAISGVMFTEAVDTNGDDCVYVEWIEGLGEDLVSGRKTPAFAVFPWKKARDAVDLLRLRFGRDSLGRADVAGLCAMAIASQSRVLAAGWDIEWSVDKTGIVWPLQMRPITRALLVPTSGGIGNLLIASSGRASGLVRHVDDDNNAGLKDGEILVAQITEADYLPAMQRSAAIITEEGGLLSHAAIVARELGKPCIVGVKNARELLEEGVLCEVDAIEGRILQRTLEIGTGTKNSEVDWSSVYLYDRGFETQLGDQVAYVEPTLSGLVAFVDEEVSNEERSAMVLSARKRFGQDTFAMPSDRRIWYREWRRFQQLPTFAFVDTLFKVGISSWSEVQLRSAEAILYKMAGALSIDKPESAVARLFNGELGAALHALVAVEVEGAAVWQAFRDTSLTRSRTATKFLDVIRGQASELICQEANIEDMRACLRFLEGMRNESYAKFSQACVFRTEYFGERNDLIKEACIELGLTYVDEDESLLDIYRCRDFIDRDKAYLQQLLQAL